ncbi:MAG: MMPL family transporter [Pseudomonadota bacterium]
MSKIGFGFERIGLVALDRPRLFSALLLVFTLVLAFFIPKVNFDGNVTSVIPRSSENLIAFENQKRDFRNFSRDVVLIIRSPRLFTASGLENLRDLQLDLAITEGVSSTVSVFSLPRVDKTSGEIDNFFPEAIESDEEAKKLIEEIVRTIPQASNLVSIEKNAAVILAGLDIGIDTGANEKAFRAFADLEKEVAAFAPEDFDIAYAGLTPIGLSIMETLIDDQVKLTLFGLLLGAVVALAFFRCPASAALCAVPPIFTSVWGIGFFGFMGVPITYMTTILPTLALILAYADGIVLHHHWMKLNRASENTRVAQTENLKAAIKRIGPASALTSFTTALAVFSFSLSSSESLVEFAYMGVVLVSFAFLSVIIALPIFGAVCIRFRLLRLHAYKFDFENLWQSLIQFFSRFPAAIALVAIVAVAGLLVVHTKLEPDYRLTDYLPYDSKTRDAERMANDVFGGRSMVFFLVPTVEEGGLASLRNRERLGEVTQLLESKYEDGRIFSLISVLEDFDARSQARILGYLENAPDEMRRGYQSKDGSQLMISLRVSSGQSIGEGSQLLLELEQYLSSLPYGDQVTITGFPILLATEFTIMINELRTSLLIAALLGICLIGIATRSFFYCAVAAIPNLFPILVMEFLIYLNGGDIDVTEVIALTLAFGIAIDNAVHVINLFEAERSEGKGVHTALSKAILEVGPALLGSTLIICSATLVMLTSGLPILPAIGTLIIAILFIALLTNLIILPANILSYQRVLRLNRLSSE